MLDYIQKFLKKLSPNKVRWIVFIFSIGLVVIRFSYQSARERIDILNFVLFCVALLAILREDLKKLISKMQIVGLPGLGIPLDNLNDQIVQAEEKYKELLAKYIDNESFRKNNILAYQNALQTNIDINFKIEEELEKIAKEYAKHLKTDQEIPKSSDKIADYLIEHEVIGKDVYQIVKKYKDIIYKKISKNEQQNLIEIAIRLFRLLQSILESIQDLQIVKSQNNVPFKGNPTDLKLGGKLFEQVEKELVALYTTVNILDSHRNAFPIIQLDKNNFKIYESKDQKLFEEAEIVKVVPLQDNIELSIILAIDISGSMNDHKKLIYAKKAAISMIKNLLKQKGKDSIKIAIYPFKNSINPFSNYKEGLMYLADGQIWSNNFSLLSHAINGLEAEGGTPLYDALRFSMEYIEEFHGYKTIICISDGEENESKYTRLSDLIVKAKTMKIPVYSIGYGTEKSLGFLVAYSKLTNAGEEGVGSFMDVSPESLANVLGHLTHAVSNAFGVYWKPNLLDKESPTFYKVQVEYEARAFGKISHEFEQQEYKLK